MGTIISSRMKDDGKVVLEIAFDHDEVIQLKGHMSNIHVFSENDSDTASNISERGKNDATKYFLIPKELRKGIKPLSKTVCRRIETKAKIIFIYMIDRFSM